MNIMKELERLSDEIKELKFMIIEQGIKHKQEIDGLKKMQTSTKHTISKINGRLRNMIFRGVKFD